MSEELPSVFAKATLIGWIRNIDTRNTGGGKKVANVTVHCGTHYGTHRVTFWEEAADRIETMGVGARVHIEAKLRRKSYEKAGATVWDDELTAQSVTLIDAAPEPEGF